MKLIYIIRFLFLCFAVSTTNSAAAQDFHLVKDINTSTNSDPNGIKKGWAVLNGISYFSADDGVNGKGLWRSDGTAAGTYLVKSGVSPLEVCVMGDKVYFSTNYPSALYKSDGTTAGINKVALNILNDSSFIQLGSMFAFNNQLLFSVNNTYWESVYLCDGTAAGTRVLLNFHDTTFNTTNSISTFSGLAVIKNKFYFNTDVFNKVDQSYGRRLWVTDGTAAGSYIIGNTVKDCVQLLENVEDSTDHKLYFMASADQGANRSLYSTNGQRGDAELIAGFNGYGSNARLQGGEVRVNNTIYFVGNTTGSNGAADIYKYDLKGSGGVEFVKGASPSNQDGTASYTGNLFNYQGTLMFNNYDAVTNKFQLWKLDKTTSTTGLLKEDLQTFDFTLVNGAVYFPGQNSLSGWEIWKSDGTVAGTALVKDIMPGTISSNPHSLLALNNKLLFVARNEAYGNELWQTDGTAAGTSVLKDINQAATGSSSAMDLTPINGKVIFSSMNATGGIYGGRLFISNGTVEGTNMITDTVYHTGAFYDQLFRIAVRNNEAYFFGESLSGLRGVYKTDGTAAGTVLVKEFGYKAVIDGFIKTNSLVYFFLKKNNGTVTELWRTDGTPGNTFSIKQDLNFFYLQKDYVVAGDNNLFLSVYGQGLLKTDGSVAGTIFLRSSSDRPENLFFNNGTLYFSYAYGLANALWKSDGTVAGTQPIADDVISAANFFLFNNEVFFTALRNPAHYANIGRQLFKTDGTANGTVLYSQLYPGPSGIDSYNFQPLVLNGLLCFLSKQNQLANIDLWLSHGDNGNELLTTLPGLNNQVRGTACNGKAFFVYNSLLWESDGTKYGTQLSSDSTASKLTISYGSRVWPVGNQLYFSGYDYKYGEELYTGFVSPPLPYFRAIYNGNWNNPLVWENGMIPTPGANVVIESNVIGNVNANCNSLHVEPGRTLTILSGVNIVVAH